MRITKSFIDNLKPPPAGNKQVFFDDEFPGFGIRNYESGRKSYVVRYKYRDKQILRVIASCKDMTVEAAKDLAKRTLLTYMRGHQ